MIEYLLSLPNVALVAHLVAFAGAVVYTGLALDHKFGATHD